MLAEAFDTTLSPGRVFGKSIVTRPCRLRMMNRFEEKIRELTMPINGQLPRPWMTTMTNPREAGVFIVGRNQRKGYPSRDISHQRHLDALFNRKGESCRGLYDSVTNDRPSPTRKNTDRLVCRLNRRNIHDILETNVICYSTPMSADLRKSAHDGGAGRADIQVPAGGDRPSSPHRSRRRFSETGLQDPECPPTEGTQVRRRDMRLSNGATPGHPNTEPGPASVQQVVVMGGWVPGQRGRPGKGQTGRLVPPTPAPPPAPARRATTTMLTVQAVLGTGGVPQG